MKTIGLIGGMSWESTTSYYQLLNKQVRESLGKLHSAKLCLYSVDFNEIAELQHKGDWQATADILIHAAQSVEAGGADFVLICTNTMHKVADEVAGSISIPILHIADATAQQLLNDGVTRVGLLGQSSQWSKIFINNALLTILALMYSSLKRMKDKKSMTSFIRNFVTAKLMITLDRYT